MVIVTVPGDRVQNKFLASPLYMRHRQVLHQNLTDDLHRESPPKRGGTQHAGTCHTQGSGVCACCLLCNAKPSSACASRREIASAQVL